MRTIFFRDHDRPETPATRVISDDSEQHESHEVFVSPAGSKAFIQCLRWVIVIQLFVIFLVPSYRDFGLLSLPSSCGPGKPKFRVYRSRPELLQRVILRRLGVIL